MDRIHEVTPLQLNNYFSLKPTWRFPGWVIALFVLAACGVCGGFGAFSQGTAGAGFTGFILLVIGVGVGIGAGFLAYGPIARYNSRDTITDATFDRWVDWQQESAKQRGCESLGMDFSRLNLRPPDPNAQLARDLIPFRGFERARYLIPVSGPTANIVVADSRLGDDGITRWRRNVFIWFFPRDRKLAMYRTAFDAVQPTEASSETKEYYYQAVSGITTSQKQLAGISVAGIQVAAVSVTEFTLRIENSDTVSAPYKLEGHLKVAPSGMEQAIKSLRDLLDETKYAQLGGSGQGNPAGGYGPGGPGYQGGGYGPGPGYATGGPGGGYAPGPGYATGPGYAPGAPGGGYATGPGYGPGASGGYPNPDAPTTPGGPPPLDPQAPQQ